MGVSAAAGEGNTDLATLLGGIFTAMGIALGVVASRHFAARRAFVRNSRVTTGVLVQLREERDGLDAQRFHYPKVQFRTESGREVVVESSMARGRDAWRIGDVVPVRYQRDRPQSAEVATFAAIWGSSLVLGFLAAVFLVLGAVLWLRLIAT